MKKTPTLSLIPAAPGPFGPRTERREVLEEFTLLSFAISLLSALAAMVIPTVL